MSLEMIQIPEEAVAALGDVNLIRRHYEDELSVNELINLVQAGEETLASWAKLPAAEKKKFLEQRGAVIAHAFGIAGRAEGQVSPLLKDAWKQAVAAWGALLPKLSALS
jgi:hypothetical protein